MEAAAQRKASDLLRLESVAATNPQSSNSKWPTNSTHRRSNSQRPAAAQIMGDLWAICDPLSSLLLRFLPYSLMKIKCEKRGLGRTYEFEYLGLRKMISYQALFYAVLVNTIQLFSLLSLLFQFSKLYVWTGVAQFVHC
ncbi:unnamed protein product [Cuscuta campestris]|uniref:Uncharacterized protein n=1 Tax=Cuscuta campestris TaxID=132261 RepID=A0A484M730_9ASTE|nr:unnamed protein product [Cuscuta campestris]